MERFFFMTLNALARMAAASFLVCDTERGEVQTKKIQRTAGKAPKNNQCF